MHFDEINTALLGFLGRIAVSDLNQNDVLNILEEAISGLMCASSSKILMPENETLRVTGNEAEMISAIQLESGLARCKGKPFCVPDQNESKMQNWLFPVYDRSRNMIGAVLCRTCSEPEYQLIAAAEKMIEAVPAFLRTERTDDFFNSYECDVSVISHEFKTPLTVVLSSLQLIQRKFGRIKDRELKADTEKYIAYAEQNLYKILRLVDNMLDMRCMEEDCCSDYEYIDLIKIITAIADEVQPYAHEHHFVLAIQNTCEKEIAIQCNLRRIERIFLNLISNAAEHTPDNGAIVIKISQINHTVCVSVENDGEPIPQAAFPHLFERFWRGEGKCRGTGLGLYIADKFVRMQKGRITVENRPEGGVRFSVFLPEFQDSVSSEGVLSSVSRFERDDSVKQLVRIELSVLNY